MSIEKELEEMPSDGTKLEDIGKEEEKETPSEPSTEEKPEEEKEPPAEEDKETEKPFHEHPRFKELVKEKNQYKTELDSLREDMESKFNEIKESSSETKAPAWFSEAFGDQPELWNKFQDYNKGDREEIKKEIREEFEAEEKETKEGLEKQNEWINDQVNSLKDEGLKFEKNDLLKVMWEYKPTDDEGNLNFNAGYKILEEQKKKDPEKSNARKEIVSEGKSKSEPEDKKWKTSEDLKGVGWDNMA